LKQLELGASGITVAKIGEAEVMRKYGIIDILIAYPIVGEQKLKWLEKLATDTEVTAGLLATWRSLTTQVPKRFLRIKEYIPKGTASSNPPSVQIDRLPEEHGVIVTQEGFPVAINDRLQIIPNHICPTVNLADELIGIRRKISN
jgi:D-serine deaminase-like pyridoxal phosphate-dependent protein